MSDFDSQAVTPTTGPPMCMSPQYSPTTAVAISLREFEKESKTQAEGEYDEDHSPLPDALADEDMSIDLAERVIQKKKRKVRSAIVSRRKKALYVEKLEAAITERENFNARQESKLIVFADVLHETKNRINALQKALDVRRDVQKRCRNPPMSVVDQGSPGENPSIFFLDPQENPLDDMHSICPDEIVCVEQRSYMVPQGGPPTVYKTEDIIRSPDFTSECSELHTSPVTPRPQRYDWTACDFPSLALKNDMCWRSQELQRQFPAAQRQQTFRENFSM